MCVSRSADAVNLPAASLPTFYLNITHAKTSKCLVLSWFAPHVGYHIDAKRRATRFCQEEAQAWFQTRHSRTKNAAAGGKGTVNGGEEKSPAVRVAHCLPMPCEIVAI